MLVVVGSSVIIACVTNEPERSALLNQVNGRELIAPASLPWEVGNALSSLFKRKRILLNEAVGALKLFQQIPITLKSVDLEAGIHLSHKLRIYAYDAYVIRAAIESSALILSLDGRLKTAAVAVGIPLLEVNR